MSSFKWSSVVNDTEGAKQEFDRSGIMYLMVVKLNQHHLHILPELVG